MTLFEIDVKETLSRVVMVKAESLDEAMCMVGDMYDSGIISLDEYDCHGVEFRLRS